MGMSEHQNVGLPCSPWVSFDAECCRIVVLVVVETILLSVVSMLSDPNCDSAANIDASIMWRDDRAAFKKKVSECVRKTLEEI